MFVSFVVAVQLSITIVYSCEVRTNLVLAHTMTTTIVTTTTSTTTTTTITTTTKQPNAFPSGGHSISFFCNVDGVYCAVEKEEVFLNINDPISLLLTCVSVMLYEMDLSCCGECGDPQIWYRLTEGRLHS